MRVTLDRALVPPRSGVSAGNLYLPDVMWSGPSPMHVFSAKLDDTRRTIELVLAQDAGPLSAGLSGGLAECRGCRRLRRFSRSRRSTSASAAELWGRDDPCPDSDGIRARRRKPRRHRRIPVQRRREQSRHSCRSADGRRTRRARIACRDQQWRGPAREGLCQSDPRHGLRAADSRCEGRLLGDALAGGCDYRPSCGIGCRRQRQSEGGFGPRLPGCCGWRLRSRQPEGNDGMLRVLEKD